MDERFQKAMQDPRLSDALKKLTPEQSKKLTQILSDPATTERLLATEQAQQLFKKILGEQNHG